MANKKQLISTNKEQKTWNLQKGDVQLNFTLRVDIKEEMKNFLEILESATESIKEELKTRFK